MMLLQLYGRHANISVSTSTWKGIMRHIGRLLISLGLAYYASVVGAAAKDLTSLLEKPLNVIHVALPRDKDNPQARPEVRCSYYPDFMVKEIDLGEEGAAQLSILPGRNPDCAKKNALNEKIISPDEWTGYFGGVYDDYIFFDAEDGWNGGLGFAVFTRGAKKLFDDVAKRWAMVSVAAIPGPAGIASGRALALRYVRVYGAKCSLAAGDGASCWQKIQRDTGLEGPEPDCSADYAREQKRTPTSAVLDDPTAIEYDVATTLAANGTHITAIAGERPTCRPED
jgi:hypothetical protein